MKKQKIIGRENEIGIFREIERSKKAHFVAVYGRRRVGKTYLIRQYFSHSKSLYLEATGVKDASIKDQLKKFGEAIAKAFFDNAPIETPASWDKAFKTVTERIQKLSHRKKIVMFLDELPWLATKRSKLVQALDYYWNAHWSELQNFTLIVCGSAASWMLDNLIHAKGGLYNRITNKIHLEPFDLKDTETFLRSLSIRLSRSQIVELYMVTGGIPFYLKEVRKGRSATQIIDDLCFKKSGLLHTEFKNLLYALFDQAEVHHKIIGEIAKAGSTLSREALLKALKISSGESINRRLYELEASGFIQCYIPYGKKRRDRYYRIVDEYTLFYLKWIEPLTRSGVYSGKESHWQKVVKSPGRYSWAGYAFEGVCLKHVHQIAVALGLSQIPFLVGTWRLIPRKGSKEQGAQIDLLFDRDDGIITICEIKYCEQKFVIEKVYGKNLIQKMEVFESRLKISKQLVLAMITTKGVKKNLWSQELINAEVTLDDLFH